MSRWKRSSSSTSAPIWRRVRHGRRKRRRRIRSRGLEDLEHRLGITTPRLLLVAELAPADRRQLVEAGATIVLGEAPARLDTARPLESVERLVQRRILDLDDTVSPLTDPARDGVAVHLAPNES